VKQDTGLRKLESIYSFLSRDFDFDVTVKEGLAVYGSGRIEYRSKQCRIAVGLDRSSVYILLAPPDRSEDCWIDIGAAISYLTNGELDDVYETYGVEFRPELPYSELISSQASELAVALKDHLPAICNIFLHSGVEDTCSALKEYGRIRANRRAGLS
jgi:hypothetical protein